MAELAPTPMQRLVLDLEDALKPAVPHLSAQELWRLAGAIFRLKREVGLPALQVAAVQRRPVYERVGRPTDEEIESGFLNGSCGTGVPCLADGDDP